jgi:hypothetical protein
MVSMSPTAQSEKPVRREPDPSEPDEVVRIMLSAPWVVQSVGVSSVIG